MPPGPASPIARVPLSAREWDGCRPSQPGCAGAAAGPLPPGRGLRSGRRLPCRRCGARPPPRRQAPPGRPGSLLGGRRVGRAPGATRNPADAGAGAARARRGPVDRGHKVRASTTRAITSAPKASTRPRHGCRRRCLCRPGATPRGRPCPAPPGRQASRPSAGTPRVPPRRRQAQRRRRVPAPAGRRADGKGRPAGRAFGPVRAPPAPDHAFGGRHDRQAGAPREQASPRRGAARATMGPGGRARAACTPSWGPEAISAGRVPPA